MLITTAIAVFLIAWSSIFLVDYVLRIRNVDSYIRFANRYGLEVSPFQIKFYITPHYDVISEPLRDSSNEDKKTDLLLSLEESRRSKCFNLLVRIWFGIGAIASIICLIGMTCYLSHVLYKDVSHWMSTRPKIAAFRGMEYRSMHNLFISTTPMPAEMKEENHQVIISADEDYDMIENGQKADGGLVPIIPGFNLPWAHIPIFMFGLIVAAIFHELGHAWAAISNGVGVNGFGIMIMGVYPGAFTDIEPTSLKRASSFKRLQIFGAGIWHNLLLALLAVVIFNTSTILMSPLLVEGRGVSIKAVDSRSGLASGSTGLYSGDVVRQIDECPVATRSDWISCISASKSQQIGRCVDKKAVEAATAFNIWTSSDEIHCCDEFNVSTAHVCFEREEKILGEKNKQTEAPQLNALLGIGEAAKPAEEMKTTTKYSCLNARHVVEQAKCNVSNPCLKEENEKICVYPALFNGTRLVKIELANRPKPILFVGQLNEMIDMVAISSYTARFSFVSVSLLDDLQLIAKYLFTLSLALGLINAMPCYALDGQFIVNTLLKSTRLSLRRRYLIRYLFLSFGTSVLVLNIVVGFSKLAFS